MTKDVAVKENSSLAMLGAMEEMAGAGKANIEGQHLVIPRLTILQATSPQLKKAKPEYIEGAQMGDLCDVGSGTKLPSPLNVILCNFAVVYIEWAPEGSEQSFIADHGTSQAILDECEWDDEDKKYIHSNGNTITETYTFWCLYQDDNGNWSRAFIPLTGTQIKSGRAILTTLNKEKITKADGTKFAAPLFYRVVEATTADRSNAKGDWSVWKFGTGPVITDLEDADEVFAEAVEFSKLVDDGMVKNDMGGAGDESGSAAQSNDGAM